MAIIKETREQIISELASIARKEKISCIQWPISMECSNNTSQVGNIVIHINIFDEPHDEQETLAHAVPDEGEHKSEQEPFQSIMQRRYDELRRKKNA